MSTSPPPADLAAPLEALRAKIDRIDQELLEALAARFSLVREVSAQKTQVGIVFRPRREQQKHKQLATWAETHGLSAGMLFQLWRVIMSQSAFEQRGYTIILGSPALELLAREYFGFDVAIKAMTSNLEAITYHQQHASTTMALLDAQDTPSLIHHQQFGHLVAAFPWQKDTQQPQAHTAYLLADSPWDLQENADLLLRWPSTEPLPENVRFWTQTDAGYLIHLSDDTSHQTPEALIGFVDTHFPKNTLLLGRIPNLL